jgi:predicted DsbA family dithiol-disulfide isomerase
VVHSRSFLLNPALPPAGMDFNELMQAKGGGRMPLEAFFTAPRQAGAKVGLEFNFERISRAPNSLLSHCLIRLAPQPLQEDLLALIYAAYFEHGQDIGDLETLVALGARLGLDPQVTRPALQRQEGQEQVEADHQWAVQHGIQGVPFYVINGRYGVSGAQPPEVLLQVLGQIPPES